ncbi:ABC transporter permease [Candidatus Bathyarchaeota archaeon]|nr:MAG: ABC transporter permease [Candidatus Bathyarchaeota archaeon]
MKRVLNTVLLIVFVITLNFIIFELMPGTQASISNLVQNPRVFDPTQVARLLKLYNFCKEVTITGPHSYNCVPTTIWDRFSAYFVNMITFNFGDSFQTNKPVLHDMIQTGRLVNTLTLLGVATTVALLIGTLLGVVAAAKRGSIFDSGSVTLSLITFSLPTFWMGLLFIMIFANRLQLFPSGGVTPAYWAIKTPDLLGQFLTRVQYLFLPALTLTLFFYGGNLLLTRATMTEALSEDYINTARAKGLPERTVLFKHALKNASLPLVTNAALSFGGLLGGAIITETVFNWDGLGFWLFNAIGWKDYPVMQAMFFIIALCVIAANFISDIFYGILDPRIKYE